MPNKPNVFISRPIPGEIVARLRETCDIDLWHTSAQSPPIADRIAALDGLMTYGHEPVTDAMMATASNLKVISNIGVGIDHIDKEAARRRGIAVGNTPGILSDATADMTFALLLASARTVVPSNRYVQRGEWMYYDPNIFWGHDVHGMTIGIVGMGRIGYAVAKRAQGFDMKVLYHKRTRREDWERELGMTYADLDTLLRESDFVTLHTPMSPETRHLIGARELGLMKPTVTLVNVARGGVVDHDALYNALKNGSIRAAALDVTDPEPINTDHPLLALENCLIVPHLGSATVHTRTKM
ncbi:MAG: D-glycerate dehydrogenase, partial [Candidatus Poribacteria bacterium]|nr:D-glycerate dehydrogenase [Candidatus Poribacteria bacterium]